MARAHATTDHTVIRRWIESRNGQPSVVRATEGRKKGSAGLLRVDFNEPEDSLEEVSWDDFFDTFDQSNLAFLFQDTTGEGAESRFHKFVNRDAVDDLEEGESEDSSGGSTRQATSAGKRGGGARQATPQGEEEIEELDEEDIEEEEDDDDDEDEDEDEADEDEDDDDLDDDDDDDDLDDDDDDDDEDEDEEEEEVTPKKKRK